MVRFYQYAGMPVQAVLMLISQFLEEQSEQR